MNSTCRLCLQRSTQAMLELLENSDILAKIEMLLSVQVVCHKLLPNSICSPCNAKLDEFKLFREKVKNNQNQLLNDLSANCELGVLQNDSQLLHQEFLIKEESLNVDKLSIEGKDDETVNTDDQPNYALKDIAKMEQNDDALQYSSEDDVTLFSIKASKKKNKVKTKKPKIVKNKEKNNLEQNDTEDSEKNNVKRIETTKLNECHKCLTCSEIFTSQNLLAKHYHERHDSEKKLDLNSYCVTENDGVKSFNCSKCERVYNTLKGVKRHMESHVVDRPFVCKVCGRTYRNVSEIIRHGRAHNGTKLTCSQCSFSTAYSGALKEHEKRHKAEFKYKCEKCQKGFPVRTWYEEHQNIHNGVKPFACDLCDLKFHMRRYLSAHRSTVHPQSLDLKKYNCMFCSLPCDSRKALTLHLKEHGVVKFCLCDICGKKLSSKEQLKFHRRVHLNDKPFTCSLCNKSFTKKYYLKLHEGTHTDERTHKCPKCAKVFKQKNTLKKHTIKHCRVK